MFILSLAIATGVHAKTPREAAKFVADEVGIADPVLAEMFFPASNCSDAQWAHTPLGQRIEWLREYAEELRNCSASMTADFDKFFPLRD